MIAVQAFFNTNSLCHNEGLLIELCPLSIEICLTNMSFLFASFYLFTPLEDLENIKQTLQDYCEQTPTKGTILLASEGINANIAGNETDIYKIIEILETQFLNQKLTVKYTPVDKIPFTRFKIKIKAEIITFKVDNSNPNEHPVGTYVKPEDWNNLISQPDVKLVDTRNEYEVEIGTFKGAKNPHIDSFTEFNDYIEEKLNPEQDEKVAVFCTGGIRCEKVTALMLSKGFKEVYHLEGGILKYLQDVPEEESLWEGECFVFDKRVAVKHKLEEGSYTLCYETGDPIPKDEEQSK